MLKIRSSSSRVLIYAGSGLVAGIFLAFVWSEVAYTTVVRDGEVALAVPSERIHWTLAIPLGDRQARVRHVVAGVSSPIELVITGYLDYSPTFRDYPSQVPVAAWEREESVLQCDGSSSRGGVPIHQSDPCNRARYRQPVV